MRVKAEQLATAIQQSLQPVYLIHGEESLLVEEAADEVRKAVRQAGANDREVWHVEGRFDWSQIKWQEQTLSLFASQRLIEIRLPSGSPGKDGGEKLRAFVSQPPQDTTLLIISGKIDTRSQKSKWFIELDNLGVTVPIWSVDANQLPNWILQRSRQRGVSLDRKLSTLIAERVEGNLFAAAQEIEKLQLLAVNGQVDAQLILDSVADNARFEAFGLMDTVFQGQSARLPRIIERLRAEGIDILTVFAAVSWSMQRMVAMALQHQQGMSIQQVMASQRPPIWDSKKAMTQAALERHSAQRWLGFLQQMAAIDQAAKGASGQCPWRLLEQLCLNVAGIQAV